MPDIESKLHASTSPTASLITAKTEPAKEETEIPTAAAPQAEKPATENHYVTLARPQAHAIFTEQYVEFRGGEVKQVAVKGQTDAPAKTISVAAAKELVKAGALVYCDAKGKPLDGDKDNK